MSHINTAAEEAANSLLMMRHGAIAVQNGKCIAKGCVIIEHIPLTIFLTLLNVVHVMLNVMFCINY